MIHDRKIFHGGSSRDPGPGSIRCWQNGCQVRPVSQVWCGICGAWHDYKSCDQ